MDLPSIYFCVCVCLNASLVQQLDEVAGCMVSLLLTMNAIPVSVPRVALRWHADFSKWPLELLQQKYNNV